MCANIRVRSFFGFDPNAMIDDIASSVMYYINSNINALAPLLTGDSGERMNEFITRLQESYIKNMDLFELYTMRNIFDIPLDLDLVDVEQEQESDIKLDDSFVADSNDYDNELLALYQRFNEQQEQKKMHVNNINELESQLSINQQILQRAAKIKSIISEAHSLPVNRVQQLDLKIKNLERKLFQ